MLKHSSIDSQVKTQLKRWPQSPPGLGRAGTDAWLRARPDDCVRGQCFLKLPGSERLRTLPDGLWLNFGGTSREAYVDIFAIEACASLTNLLDKRSRFAPSTHSLMAYCPVPWLLAPVTKTDAMPRWRATGVLTKPPVTALVLPVRDLRVMYGLQPRHYERFVTHQVPHPHEFFVPMAALTAVDGDRCPAMQALVARASVTANFFDSQLA